MNFELNFLTNRNDRQENTKHGKKEQNSATFARTLRPLRLNLIALCAISILFLLFANEPNAQNLAIKSFVDRTKIAEGQQFTLTIELSGADAQGAPTPELPDISSFADYVGSGSQQNIQFINGKISVIKSTANYYIAKTVGKHQIPAITFNYKGKDLSSQPISIEILKGTAQPSNPGRQQGQRPGTPQSQITPESSLKGNLFLRAEVDNKTVYQNQPLVLTYKIYTRVDVSNYAISKLPGTLGFWSEDLSTPQKPVTYEQVINGKRFLIAEIKKVALFPTDAGEKTIEPMEIDCEVRVQDRRRRSVFDDFFNDDFFNNSMFGRRVRSTIKSEPLKITVKPLPLEGKPADFSGAVGNFTMNATLDKDQVTANEAITLKVKYSGNGNIKMLPEPEFTFPPNIETYDPKTTLNIDRTGNTIRGNKTTEFVLIPRFAGDYRIKPIAFTYFDPDQATYKTLRTPEFMIKVSAGSGTGVPIASGISREEVKLIGQDIRFIKSSTENFQKIGVYFYQSFLFGLFLFVPLLAFGGAVIYKQRQEKMTENVAYARSRKANQMAKKRLSKAYKMKTIETQKEFYAEISNALLGFVADKLNLSAAGLISDEVAGHLRDKNVSDDLVSEFLNCLQECDYQRFAPSGSKVENMNNLYERARKAIIELEKAKLS